MYPIYRYIDFVYRKGNSIVYIQRKPFYNDNFSKVNNFERNQPLNHAVSVR